MDDVYTPHCGFDARNFIYQKQQKYFSFSKTQENTLHFFKKREKKHDEELRNPTKKNALQKPKHAPHIRCDTSRSPTNRQTVQGKPLKYYMKKLVR